MLDKEIKQRMLDKEESSIAGAYYNGDEEGCRLLLEFLKIFHPDKDPEKNKTLDHK